MSVLGVALPGTPARARRAERRSARRPHAVVFAAVVAAVLVAGMLGLLAVNTILAQDSFTQYALSDQQVQLQRTQNLLAQELAVMQAPATLAARAQALGMVPDTVPVFLRLSTGAVLGDQIPAPTPAPVVVAPVVVAVHPVRTATKHPRPARRRTAARQASRKARR